MILQQFWELAYLLWCRHVLNVYYCVWHVEVYELCGFELQRGNYLFYLLRDILDFCLWIYWTHFNVNSIPFFAFAHSGIFDSIISFNCKLVFLFEPVLFETRAEASQSIAAHVGLGSIFVKNLHMIFGRLDLSVNNFDIYPIFNYCC